MLNLIQVAQTALLLVVVSKHLCNAPQAIQDLRTALSLLILSLKLLLLRLQLAPDTTIFLLQILHLLL